MESCDALAKHLCPAVFGKALTNDPAELSSPVSVCLVTSTVMTTRPLKLLHLLLHFSPTESASSFTTLQTLTDDHSIDYSSNIPRNIGNRN